MSVIFSARFEEEIYFQVVALYAIILHFDEMYLFLLKSWLCQ